MKVFFKWARRIQTHNAVYLCGGKTGDEGVANCDTLFLENCCKKKKQTRWKLNMTEC